VSEYHTSVLLTILAGAVLAAIVGGLLAVPVLRLGGIYLALATFAFALMFESILIPLDWVGGGAAPIKVPRPTIGPVDFANNRSFFFLCLAVLAVVSVLVIFVRGGTTGRFLDALRGSETAAQAIGINPARARIIAMALSAGIAGLGGGLLATQSGLAQPADYNSFLGLYWVVLVVTLGSRTVEGGIQAGIGFIVVDELLKRIGVNSSWEPILFGLGAITYARHPEGILEFQKRKAMAFVQRHLDRMSGKSQPADQLAGAGDGGAVAPATTPSSERVGAD
jgi:ABC-type branched-subunit amino acid transport system permease subunit